MVSNLKVLREKAGLSLQDLGDLCGIAKQSLWNLEGPKANPTISTAYKVATALCVQVTDIWPNTMHYVEETITVRRLTTKEPPCPTT